MLPLTPNQAEIEDLLRAMGDRATLKLFAEIRKLRCENQHLLQIINSRPHPTQGNGSTEA